MKKEDSMKRKSLFLFPSLIAMSLTACANANIKISDYILELNYSNNYRILQLSDTHIGDKDNTQLHYDFMDLTIKDANPDLIVITGDVFTFASKGTAKEFFKFMDGHGVPWTIVFGNHDEQCYFSIDWVTKQLEKCEHCVFKDIRDDKVQGNSNFAINLKVGDAVFEQLIMMDSNRYYYGDYFGYDCFKENQIEWYKDLVNYTTKQYGVGGLPVVSRMFYHIPLPEVNDVWEYAKEHPEALIKIDGKEGVKEEESCNPKHDHNFFDVIKSLGSTRGMYFGHDHINNFVIRYKVSETYFIDFGYGIKATDRVYYSEQLLGGRVITIRPDHSVDYDDIYHKYEEVMK